VAGKTVSRRVTDEQIPLYQASIANRRRLRKIIADIEEVSNRATEILLKQRAGGLHLDSTIEPKPLIIKGPAPRLSGGTS
jgi:hypothetical protein